MKRKVFIQSNDKQQLGAILAKYAIERYLPKDSDITVEIMNVDGNMKDIFSSMYGKEYLHNGEIIKYDPNDLQSFTLVRFMPPELMHYEGKALVIDPDIFALTDVTELFDMDLQGKDFMACSKKGSWDSSVMLLDCSRLRHWNIKKIFEDLMSKNIDYVEWSALVREKNVLDLPRIWNSLDHLDENTKMLHTTGRITQPWKTGLPIDFRRKKMGKLFGFIPRELIHKLIGRYESKYKEHPDEKIRKFFFGLASEALNASVVTRDQIKEEIKNKNIRPDFLDIIDGKKSE